MTEAASAKPFGPFGPETLLPTQLADGWLKAQTGALSAMRAMTEHWLDHRRKSVEALWKAMERMSTCRDTTEIAAVQRELTSDAFNQIRSEFASLADEAMKLTQSTSGLLGQSTNGHSAAPLVGKRAA